jgi:hypothetical protein
MFINSRYTFILPESFNCQYLQLDNTSEVNTELISFDMFGFDGNEKNPSPKDSPLGKQGNLGHLNICVTSVKVILNLHYGY